jgi:type IV pilus assembly protein PilY1
MTTARFRLTRRLLSGLMAFLIGFGPLTPLAMAATTSLADGPINVSIKAHPNIVFTLDDSTSMMLEFLPDYVVVDSLTNAATSYCRSSTGLQACGSVGSATIPQYDYATWMTGAVGAVGSFPYPSGYGNSSYGPPVVMASAFNAMFYNPGVTYTAPLKYDGTSYNDMNATNTTNWTKVPADPYLFPTKYVNLQTKVSVGVWCNTTYAGTQANLNGLTIGGDYCRINGYPYALASNGAPKTLGDYSYPYAKVAADADNSKFFATTTRTIYCDPNRMNGTTTTGTAEVKPTAPTCDACALSCPVAQVEDPTSPAGCDLGCTNPAECTKCNLKCPVAQTYSCGMNCTTPALNCTAVGGGNYAAQPKSCSPGPNQKCTTHAGACATTGAWKLDSAACSTKINGKGKVAWTPTSGTIINTTTYEQDANLNGDVCRRNNFTYPDGTVAGGWTFPTGNYTTAVGSCGTITATINRHYYKASVQWCDTQLPTGGSNDKWRGYGKGNCQAEKTSVYKYPRFFKGGAHPDSDFATPQDNYGDNTAFQLVELDYVNKKIIVANGTPATSITHTLVNGDTVARDSTSTTPAASELVNYANWFAYYRSRILAGKTVTSLAFSDLTDKFRVGFHTMSNYPASTFLNLSDFTGGAGKQRDLWYQKLASISIPMGNDTPSLDAVSRIGEWFSATSGTSASLSGSTDPITLSCQKNYHILFTDGYTNQAAQTSGLPGNVDGAKIPTLPETIIDLVPGTDWPKKIKEGSTAVSDSLSDYTLKYWLTDLRPNTFAAKVSDNNVPSTENDPAKWQHLNFAALSLGTEGVLPSLNSKKTEDQITAGTLTWPTPTPVNRPGVAGVDDLWHAAIAGRSQFVNARDPQELQTGMASILNEIKNLQAARAGAAFSSVNFAKDNNFIYRVTIEPGWGGTLTKVLVDPKGGGEVSIGTKYHDVLAAQVTPSVGNTQPWYDKRNVITWDPSAKAATAFRLGKMPTSESDTLGKDDTERERIIAYLRGDRSNEGSALKNYRVRSQVLGDIVNSSPVVVGPSPGQYSDSTDPGYEAFKKTNETRKKMVYVGSNDGMLHAFDEDTGTEVWAYVPSTVYSSVADTGLAMLAKKDPFFKHQMFVDATPVAVDVNVGGTWKTLLIGGVGKGGKSYYAIDVTDPAGVKTEDDAKAKVLWEFNDSDMGYTFGKPLIGKTYADNTWVAVLPAGYNNGSGKGKLFFVRLSDGKLLRTLETSEGSGSDPLGLSQVSGFVLSFKNQFIEQIYGGDLKGNVWRFDVSSADASKWSVDKLATLTSTDGTAQSVTTAPQIEVDFANGVDRYVMVGTGRLLHEDDLTTYGDQVQTMYVIRDGTVLKMNTSGLPYNPRTDSDFSTVDAAGTTGFSGLSVKGWYMDLPKGERIIAPIAAELNLLGFAGSLPPENECLPGLAANIYVRDFPHGDSQLVDSGGAAMASSYAKEGAVGMEFINIYSDTPNDPTLKLAITLGSDGKTIYIDLKKGSLSGDHRMSWRLMGQ